MRSAIRVLSIAAAVSPAVGGSAASPLVDADWVDERLNDPAVRVVSLAETQEQYDEGHVPGAVFLDWRTDILDAALPERYNKVAKPRMEELLSAIGVSRETTVVLYDNLHNRLAVRMYWMLRYYGHDDAYVLNGGKEAWRRAGKPLVAEVRPVESTDYRVEAINPAYAIGLESLQPRVGSPDLALVDGRPPVQFTGEAPGKVYHTGAEHRRRGHIPGAVNIPWKSNLNPDGTFKSSTELRAMYSSRGVTRDKQVVTYCNEGLHAAMPWFVLTELLNYPRATVYDDSLSEWANRDSTPMELGQQR